MKIEFELNEIHRAILSSIYLGNVKRRENIRPVMELLLSTEGDYRKLLEYLADSYSQGSGGLGVYPQQAVEDESFVRALQELEVLSLVRLHYPLDNKALLLTEEGVRIAMAIVQGRRAILRAPESMQGTVFIASSFGHDQLDTLFDLEISPACEQVGLLAFRVDMSEPEQTITDRIFQAIRACKCLIGDLTFARPSVYFEIGLAQGLGVPILLTCREDHYRNQSDQNRVHFDLEQYKISFWRQDANGNFLWPKKLSPRERLLSILQNRITLMRPPAVNG